MLAPQTLEKVLDLAGLVGAAIPESARGMARLSLFDWLAVGRAGAGEPVAKIVRGYVAADGGRAAASVFGLDAKLPARAAALANGTISHALDYDDTHFGHVGHPSVAVLPAALALGEARGRSAADVLDAFVLGAEVSIRVGLVLGRAHYDRGFHQTATAGAFGATVAAARALGLDRAAIRQALSLVATRASGLKSQFGTMGKPFNAGLAASNGVEATELAERGFVSCDDGLGGPQGFIDAHVDFADEAKAWSTSGGEFLFEDVKHKLHACCHGLHAAIEAIRSVKAELDPGCFETLVIRTNPRWLRVCDIKRPRTGLEAKFSYALTAGMTLYGIDTSADRAYTDDLCRDPRLVAFLSRVTVEGDETIPDTAARIEARLAGAAPIVAEHDLAARSAPEALARGLRAKAAALLGAAAADRLWEATGDLGRRSAADLGVLLTGRAYT
jgi:2-methylcitrate dehydratase PrpD